MVQSGQAAMAAAAKKKAEESKKKPKTTASTTAEDTAGNPPTATASGKTALSGLPVGTPIRTGMTAPSPTGWSGGKPTPGQLPVYSKAQYTDKSAYEIPATLGNAEKANLLLRLSLIPGLYSKGQAPTEQFIRNMASAGAVSLRPQDFTALTKVLTVADLNGENYETTLFKFINNPGLSQQYFGKVTETPKEIVVSSPDALKSELNSRFLDMFNMQADAKTVTNYVKEVNALEKKAGLAKQSVTAQQREDIFNKYVAQTANSLYAKVKGTTDTKDDVALEKGALGATVRVLRNAYADNGIPVKDSDIYKLAISATRSQQALQNTLDDINMQASINFPALKDWFSKGKTAKQFFAPYTTAYSRIYGVPEDQVDVTKFYDVASGTSVVPVNTWIKNQWSNPAIKDTDYYKEINRNDLRAVAEAFGMTV